MMRGWSVALALVLAGVGIWGFVTQVVGTHVTDCHFDAQGAYAKVRVNNLLGSSAHTQRVYVDFYVKGSHYYPEDPYGAGIAVVTVPAHGRGTAVMHTRFPPHGSLRDATAEDDQVQGRTVYVRGASSEQPRFVTRTDALRHPGGVSVETVPDDPGSLRCSITGDGY